MADTAGGFRPRYRPPTGGLGRVAEGAHSAVSGRSARVVGRTRASEPGRRMKTPEQHETIRFRQADRYPRQAPPHDPFAASDDSDGAVPYGDPYSDPFGDHTRDPCMRPLSDWSQRDARMQRIQGRAERDRDTAELISQREPRPEFLLSDEEAIACLGVSAAAFQVLLRNKILRPIELNLLPGLYRGWPYRLWFRGRLLALMRSPRIRAWGNRALAQAGVAEYIPLLGERQDLLGPTLQLKRWGARPPRDRQSTPDAMADWVNRAVDFLK